MIHYFLKLLVIACVAYGITFFLEGVQFIEIQDYVIFALILGLFNTFIKPVLKTLTLPINFFTFGLFSLIVNGVIMLLIDHLLEGFSVDGLFTAIIFSFLLSLGVSVVNLVLPK